jgi:hypothetical protein
VRYLVGGGFVYVGLLEEELPGFVYVGLLEEELPGFVYVGLLGEELPGFSVFGGYSGPSSSLYPLLYCPLFDELPVIQKAHDGARLRVV